MFKQDTGLLYLTFSRHLSLNFYAIVLWLLGFILPRALTTKNVNIKYGQSRVHIFPLQTH